MNRLSTLVIVAVAGLLVTSSAVFAGPAGPPGGLDVNVVGPLPLQVEGDVNANVSGTVEVSNSPNVSIVNTQSDPVPIHNSNEPGSVPYEVSFEFCLTAGYCFLFEGYSSTPCANTYFSGATLMFDLPAVPSNKRLIIKRVSGLLPADQPENAHVALQGQRIVSLQHLKWLYAGPFFLMVSGLYGFDSGDMFITYGPEETPHINIRAPAPSNYNCNMAISGYLIDVN